MKSQNKTQSLDMNGLINETVIKLKVSCKPCLFLIQYELVAQVIEFKHVSKDLQTVRSASRNI